MSLRDFLTIKNEVVVNRTISTNDGMGSATATTYMFTFPLATIWLNSTTNRYLYDRYSMDSSHTLAFEYGQYTFNKKSDLSTGQSAIETVSYNGEEYNTVGFMDDVMNLHEICIMHLDRFQ
jgi:hypothetical protein